GVRQKDVERVAWRMRGAENAADELELGRVAAAAESGKEGLQVNGKRDRSRKRGGGPFETGESLRHRERRSSRRVWGSSLASFVVPLVGCRAGAFARRSTDFSKAAGMWTVVGMNTLTNIMFRPYACARALRSLVVGALHVGLKVERRRP